MPTVYEIVTERIIAKLEQGIIPWRRPWHAESGLPRNLVSGGEYRGVNVFLLACQGYESPYWLSFKQARELGGSVKKGEKATPVVFWKWVETQQADPETGLPATRRIPLLRYYSVFSITQCEGVRHRRLLELVGDSPKPFTPIAHAEAIVTAYPSPPSIHHGGKQAFYRPADDAVTMPPRETFETPESFYSVLFHELIHSTGHSSRLARPGVTQPIRFASHEYSREELVAEMGASFLRAVAGINSEPLMTNSAAYLQGWLRALRKDARMLVIAGAQAQKAADWILGKKAAEEAEATTELELAA
jgi:antirestriction protein ArdC